MQASELDGLPVVDGKMPRAVRHAKLLQFIGNESGDVDGRRRDGRFNRGNLSE